MENPSHFPLLTAVPEGAPAIRPGVPSPFHPICVVVINPVVSPGLESPSHQKVEEVSGMLHLLRKPTFFLEIRFSYKEQDITEILRTILHSHR